LFQGVPDSIIAAIITAIASILITWFTLRNRYAEKRIDMASKQMDTTSTNLEAQLKGWREYSGELRARITELETTVTRCEARVEAVVGLYNEAQGKLADAVRDLSNARAENARLKTDK
jgi:uncharacterized protein YoxC